MGYSTAIYAVDLDKLSAVVGSGDARLLKRLRPATKKKPSQGPRVFQDRQGQIFLNGRPVTFDALITELRRRTWKGTNCYYNEAMGIRRGRWRKFNSLLNAVVAAMPSTQFETYEWGADGGEDDDLSEEDAAAELIEGRVSQPGLGHQYGYGLEHLCRLLGTLLTAIEGRGGLLKALQLNTPLSKGRSPVPLPRKARGDFPAVGYLTAAEVRREVERLGAMDLSYPRDDEIEADRRDLLRALQKAARKKVGVVAFYH